MLCIQVEIFNEIKEGVGMSHHEQEDAYTKTESRS